MCMQFEKDKEGEQTKALARILFDTALLESGFAIEQPKDFNTRVHRLLASSLGIKGELKVDVEPDEPEVSAGLMNILLPMAFCILLPCT